FFKNRFDREPWIIEEIKNQRDSDFWRTESLLFKTPLEVPAYLIGGLLDGYKDFAPYIFETSHAPVKMDIGPYNHSYPNNSPIGPRYEWRELATRWWDYWLKGINNGILDEPLVTIFVRSGHEPSTVLSETPGKWRSEATWPIAGTINKKYYPSGTPPLVDTIPAETEHSLVYSPGAGMSAGGWWGEATGDMAGDDAKSLVYDSEELKEDIQIIGMPKVSLRVQSDAPLYQWTVRLEDVSPNGKVSLISGALINPTQRNDRLDPEALNPGETTTLSTRIHFTTWTFKAGHRVRLSISNAQFPMAWPTPSKGSTKLITGSNTWLELPVPPPPSLPEPSLPDPTGDDSPSDYKEIYWFGPTSSSERDEIEGISTFTTSSDAAWTIGNKNFASSEFYSWIVKDDDPAGASYSGMRRNVFEIPGTSLVLSSLFDISSDASNFKISITRTLLKNGKLSRTKSWNETIPRDFQ
ncbi:MAG: CocE/NonD family hydrolase, partial [Atribacterota bacterium]